VKDNAPIMLIECKHWSENLDPHDSQLFRYFHTTSAKFGILTNGIMYRFYTDLVEANKMDEKPFFEFRIDDMKEAQIEKLKEFTKTHFNIESINTTASELKYMSELRVLIVKEISDPSEDFTKYFAKSVYHSMVTAKILDMFRGLVKRTFNQYINDTINERLKTALATEQQKAEQIAKEELTASTTDETTIVTTAEEMEAFYIIRAILAARVNVTRIVMRDNQSYCGILLDDNNRRPICRLHFNQKKKQVSFFDRGKEEKVILESNNKLYEYSSRFIKIVDIYDKSSTNMIVDATN
jgi:predicted type IV restriction endonuclease